jgi:hypothetical protein
MAKQIGERLQVFRGLFQEPGRESMPQRARRDLGLDAGALGSAFHAAYATGHIDGFSVMRDKRLTQPEMVARDPIAAKMYRHPYKLYCCLDDALGPAYAMLRDAANCSTVPLHNVSRSAARLTCPSDTTWLTRCAQGCLHLLRYRNQLLW